MVLIYHVNNVFNFQINNVSSNGTLDFGNTILRGHSINQQQTGGQNVVGPAILSPRQDFSLNLLNDPSFIDQPQRGVN